MDDPVIVAGDRALRVDRRFFLRALPLVLLGVADSANHLILSPLLPQIQTQAGLSTGAVGLLAGTFPAVQFFGYIVGFRALPVFGSHRAILIGGSLGIAADSVLVVAELSSQGYLYFLGRAVGGLGSSLMWNGLLLTFLRLAPRPEDGATAHFVAYGTGAIVGAGLAGIDMVAVPFVLHGALVVLGTLGGRRVAVGAPSEGSNPKPVVSPVYRYGIVGWAIGGLLLGVYVGVLPLGLATEVTQAQMASLYVMGSVGSIVGAILVRVLCGPDRFTPHSIACLAYASTAVCFLIVSLGGSFLYLMTVMAWLGITRAGAASATMVVLADAVQPAAMTQLVLITSVVFSATFALSPPIAAAIFERVGLPILMCGLLIVVVVYAMLLPGAARHRITPSENRTL